MTLAEYFKVAHPSPVRQHRIIEPPEVKLEWVPIRVRRVLVAKVGVLVGFAIAAATQDVAVAFWTAGAANAYWLFFIKE